MKKFNGILLTVFFAFVITACQKEFSIERITTTALTISASLDSNYIDTVYEFETRNGIIDTTAYYSYKYDAQKRVISVNWQLSDFLLPYQDSGIVKYFYNSTDSLPHRSNMAATYNGMLAFDTTITFFSYDNSGRLIKDSVIDSERDISYPYYRLRHYVNLYNYSVGKIIRKSSDLPIIEPSLLAYPPTYSLDTATIGTNQNPVSSVGYVSYNNNTSFFKDYETIVSYDSNPSPYYKLNISKSFSPIPVVDGPAIFMDFIGKNNYTNYYTTYPAGGSNSSIIYNNTYFNNSNIKTTSFTTTFTNGYIYTYKPL